MPKCENCKGESLNLFEISLSGGTKVVCEKCMNELKPRRKYLSYEVKTSKKPLTTWE